MNINNLVWVEKYRPTEIDDLILPNRIKSNLLSIINSGSMPNLLLSGQQPGIGKTTSALILAKKLGYEYIMVNASKDGNIDTLRTRIQNFASTVSINKKRKMVLLDEADGLTATTQEALRNFMEAYSKNCVFVLTCNNENHIIEPLKSRGSVINYHFSDKEKNELMRPFLGRVKHILKEEGIKCDDKICAAIILRFFPDMRRILNELQRHASSGSIDVGVLAEIDLSVYDDLFSAMKDKKWEDVKKWVFEHTEIPFELFVKDFFVLAKKHCSEETMPALVLLLNDYSYKHSFVANKSINLLACLTEIMMNVNWK